MENYNHKYLEKQAKDMTEKYLRPTNPDLMFVPIYAIDEDGNPTITFKIVKVKE